MPIEPGLLGRNRRSSFTVAACYVAGLLCLLPRPAQAQSDAELARHYAYVEPDESKYSPQQKAWVADRGKQLAEVRRLSLLLTKEGTAAAIALLDKVTAQDRAVFGPAHPEVADRLLHLADLYGAMDDHARAIRAANEARQIREARYGADDRRTRLALIEIKRLTTLANLTFQEAGAARLAANRANDFRTKAKPVNYPALLKDSQSLVAELQRFFGVDNWYEVNVQLALADSARTAADYPKAFEHVDRAEKLAQGWFGPFSTQALSCLEARADLYQKRGELAPAENLYEQALVLTRKIAGLPVTSHLMVVSALRACASDRGQRQKGLVISEQMLKDVKAHPELDRTWLTRATREYAQELSYFRNAEAIQILETLLSDISQRKETPESQLAECYALLGGLQSKEKQYSRAIVSLKKADELFLRLFGKESNAHLRNLRELAITLEHSGDLPAAVEAAQLVIADGRAALGPQSLVLRDAVFVQLRCLGSIATKHFQQEEFDAAAKLFTQRVELVKAHLPQEGSLARQCEQLVEQVQFERGLSAEGRRELSRALTLHEEGKKLTLADKQTEALEKYLSFSEIVDRLGAGNRPEMIKRRLWLAEAYGYVGRFHEAIAECDRVRLMIAAAYPEPLDPDERKALALTQGKICVRQQDPAKAADSYREALNSLRRRVGIDNKEYLDIAEQLIRRLNEAGRYGETLPVAGEAIEIARRVSGDQTAQYLNLVNIAGVAHFRLGQYEPAERSFRVAMSGYSKLGDPGAVLADLARRNLASVLEATRRWSDALPLYKASAEFATAKKNSPLAGTNLIALTRVHRELRQYSDAEGTAEQAIRLLEASGNDSDLAQDELERTWIEMRETAIAFRKFKEASAISQKQLAFRRQRYADVERLWKEFEVIARENERWTALSPEQVDQAILALEQLKEADQLPQSPAKYDLAKKATARLGNLIGADSLSYMNGLKTQGDLADPNTAVQHFTERMELMGRILKGTLAECDALCDLAKAHQANSDPERAIEDYRAALSVLDEFPKKYAQPARRAHINGLMARILQDSGRASEGIPLLLAAHEEMSRYRSRFPFWYLESLQAISSFKADAESRVAIAFTQELRAESLRLRGAKSIGHCADLNIVASILTRHGQTAEAEECVRECLNICREIGADHSNSATNARMILAQILTNKNQIADAIRLTTQVLSDVKAKASNPYSAQLRRLYALLGQLHLLSGNDAAAEQLLTPVIAGANQAGVRADADSMKSLEMALALSRLLSGRANDAFDVFSRLRQRFESPPPSDRQFQSEREQLSARLNNRAVVDRLLQAGMIAQKTAETYQHALRYKGGMMFRQRQLRQARQSPEVAPLFARWGEVSSGLAKHFLRQPTPTEQAAWDQRLAQLTLERDDLERKLFARVSGSGETAATPDEVAAALPARAILLDLLRYEALERGADRSLKRALRYAIFVSRPGKPVMRVDVANGAEVDRLVNDWRSALRWRSQPAAIAAGDKGDQGALLGLYIEAMSTQASAAAKLKSLVWEPLKPFLDGIETVFVAPDEELAKFPLCALPGDKPDTYLIEQYRFSGIPLPGRLPEMVRSRAKKDPSPGKSLLVGDVNYDAPRSRPTASSGNRSLDRAVTSFYFSPLIGTGPEANAIKAVYERQFTNKGPETGVTLLLGDEASEENVLRASRSHRWLHLATHGFFAEDVIRAAKQARLPLGVSLSEREAQTDSSVTVPESLMAGLALAQANYVGEARADDGILTAAEISTEALEHVELAVMSACEAILGKSVPGEGMQGLERAFHVAGVRSTITTLWPVSDQGARLLMSRFYLNLWERKMSKVDALREAQLWCLTTARRSKDEDVPDVTLLDARSNKLPPSFQGVQIWAPFVLGGDWE